MLLDTVALASFSYRLVIRNARLHNPVIRDTSDTRGVRHQCLNVVF